MLASRISRITQAKNYIDEHENKLQAISDKEIKNDRRQIFLSL